MVAIWIAVREPEIEAPLREPRQPTEPDRIAQARPRRKYQPPQTGSHSTRSVYAPPEMPRPDRVEPTEEDTPDDSLVPPSELLDLLSARGLPRNAEPHSAKRTVAGHTVSQVRIRFADDDGTVTEIEVTDMGAVPPVQLLTALGFDPRQKDEATNSGFRLTMDDHGRLGNWEYDHEAMTGMFQVLVAERFMVEVRLEGVEAEAFKQFFHDGIPIPELEAAAGHKPVE